jgi:O-antigen ligase
LLDVGAIVFERQVSVRNIALFVFLAAAAVFLAKTRTAVLLFVLGFLIVTLCSIRWSWKSVLFIAVFICSISTLWTYAVNQPRPATCVVNEVKAAPWEILHLRAVCTLQQVNDLREGKIADDDGMRSEIYRITSGIISEQPLLGHGAGSWMPIYHARADRLSSGTMTTPHSDYLCILRSLG